MTFKKGDRVVKINRYSKDEYCKEGGDEDEAPIGTAGEVSSINNDLINVNFDNGTNWNLHESELQLESVYKLRRYKMIDTKKLKKGVVIKAEHDNKVCLFEIASAYDKYDKSVQCHGVNGLPGYNEANLEQFRKDYPRGNWKIKLDKIKQILSRSKTIEVGDDVVVKRYKGKNWYHSGDTKDGSIGKVDEVIADGEDYRIKIDGDVALFHKNEVMKTDSEFPKYAIIYDGNYEVNTWGVDLPTMKEQAKESIKKTSDKKVVIYELKPIVKMQATIKIQNIGKKTKTRGD